jgi:hypothetical protein
VLQRQQAAAVPASEPPPEGHHKATFSEEFMCHRPGCYERFSLQPRSPCQRFCGALCRHALRRVLERERRWRRRWAVRLSRLWTRPRRAPDDG